MSSSMNKVIAQGDAEVSEESGWTDYLQDFSFNRKENMNSFTSSMISDAAWNGFNGISNPLMKKLNFKNHSRKSSLMKYSGHDDLEDTASSPVNSPKVSNLKQMDVNCRRTDTFDHILGKEEAGNIAFSDIGRDEKNGNNFIEMKKFDEEYVDLKRRGLCVVPMSVWINYFRSA